MDHPYMEQNNLENQSQHQNNQDSNLSYSVTDRDHSHNNNNINETLQPQNSEHHNFQHNSGNQQLQQQPQHHQHQQTPQLHSSLSNVYGVDISGRPQTSIPSKQQHLNYQPQSQYTLPISQNQPPVLHHPHLPVQNLNYIPNSYQQLPITQSPYGFQHQPPPQSQNQSQPFNSTKTRHSYDSKSEETTNTSTTNNPLSYVNNERNLVAPIPPLHVQQQLVSKQNDTYNPQSTTTHSTDSYSYQTQPPQLSYQPMEARHNNHESSTTGTSATIIKHEDHQHQPLGEGQQMVKSTCTRCKKEFFQPVIIPKANDNSGSSKSLTEPKIFKLCHHCRDLQRQRSRRWQKKTKNKQGVCRRCGSDIPFEERKFVLCPSCRQNLRTRKANRAAQGKCVHCSGPLDTSILHKDENGNIITENNGSPTLNNNDLNNFNNNDDSTLSPIHDKKNSKNSTTTYKVCQRCRENDKIRRTNLEKMGNCNRCAKALDPSDYGKHKVCIDCRSRKKKSLIKSEPNTQAANELNYTNIDQSGHLPEYNPNLIGHNYQQQPPQQQQQPYTSYPYSSTSTNMIPQTNTVQLGYTQQHTVPQLAPHQPYTSSHFTHPQHHQQQQSQQPQPQQQQQQPQNYYHHLPTGQEFYPPGK
ncbi:uncharacterized protein KGF55_003994 [Candida pseudojiufengensis]|uniref:uncharacterized protein n=1 Tax=Candida pseudojiufengensis TaxID=497109 RepID=UPI00222543FC|nr:uncharacterized protein KGF55_003994 [Candida pseudojiufengensis]KAI5961371.1 hypothetical protein KGF55_003994 [Candida pseudojiufengensis]